MTVFEGLCFQERKLSEYFGISNTTASHLWPVSTRNDTGLLKYVKEKTEMNHLVVKPRNQWLKHFLLILLISLFSTGVVSTVTYLTVDGKSQKLEVFQFISILYTNLSIKKIFTTIEYHFKRISLA